MFQRTECWGPGPMFEEGWLSLSSLSCTGPALSPPRWALPTSGCGLTPTCPAWGTHGPVFLWLQRTKKPRLRPLSGNPSPSPDPPQPPPPPEAWGQRGGGWKTRRKQSHSNHRVCSVSTPLAGPRKICPVGKTGLHPTIGRGVGSFLKQSSKEAGRAGRTHWVFSQTLGLVLGEKFGGEKGGKEDVPLV